MNRSPALDIYTRTTDLQKSNIFLKELQHKQLKEYHPNYQEIGEVAVLYFV